MPFCPVVLFWAAFVTALTSHTFVVAAFGAFTAYFVAERWQRWRQRRDFQHRAMLEFAEASTAVIGSLWDLARARDTGGLKAQRYLDLVAEYPHKLEPLVSRDAQFYSVFEKPLIGQLVEFTGLMKRVHQRICDPNLAVALDPPSAVRPVIDCLSARRRLVIARMALEMRLRRRREVKALERELGEQAASVPPHFAS